MIKINKVFLGTFLMLSLLAFAEDKVSSSLDSLVLQSGTQAIHKKKISKRAQEALQIVQNAKQNLNLKSVMFGLWIDGDEVLLKALGISMTDVKATKEMHFRAGGVTETFETTLLLELVDQGKVSLDDPLSHWFPNLPASDFVTLRMLANSTSGYFDYVSSPAFLSALKANPFRKWLPEELIAIGMAHPMLFVPGTSWKYSHTNFIILGEVLKKVTGTSLAQALEQYIIRPLNLQDTIFPLNSEMIPPVLHAFSSERGIYEEATYWNPSWASNAGLLISNLSDLVKWTKAFGTGQLISKKSYTELLAPTTVGLGPFISPKLYFGLGMAVENSWLFTNPAFNGYSGIIAYFQPEKIVLVIFNTLNEGNSNDFNYSQAIFSEVARFLTPDHPITSPLPPIHPPHKSSSIKNLFRLHLPQLLRLKDSVPLKDTTQPVEPRAKEKSA